MSHVLAIDAHSLIYRSYYAAHHAGGDVDVVQGIFLRLLRSTINRFNPQFVLACADGSSETFRHRLAPSYKANRSEAPDELKDALAVSFTHLKRVGIPVYRNPDFEADDLLGTLAAQIRDGHLLTVVSSDRDLVALVSDRCQLYLLQNGKDHRVVTTADAHDIFKVDPSLVTLYKAIVGDTSDNIPGVRGVGPKGALKLLAECSTVADVLERCESIDPRAAKKIHDDEAGLRLSYQLADIRRDVPVELDAAQAQWTAGKAAELAG